MKSSFHRRIPFLALILRLPIPKTRLHSIPLLSGSYPGRLASRSSTLHFRLHYCTIFGRVFWRCPFITPRHGPHRKHSLYCWQGVFTGPLPLIDVQLSRTFACSAMCLPSRCLAMGIHVTIFKEIMTVYYYNYIAHVTTLCGQNAQSFKVNVGCTCSSHSI
jgi:hypothetical protein